jgi:hypothetical protein
MESAAGPWTASCQLTITRAARSGIAPEGDINGSLSGDVERSDGDIDWHFADNEFEQHIDRVVSSINGNDLRPGAE